MSPYGVTMAQWIKTNFNSVIIQPYARLSVHFQDRKNIVFQRIQSTEKILGVIRDTIQHIYGIQFLIKILVYSFRDIKQMITVNALIKLNSILIYLQRYSRLKFLLNAVI